MDWGRGYQNVVQFFFCLWFTLTINHSILTPEGTPMRSGRVKHTKCFFFRKPLFLLPRFWGHQDLSCNVQIIMSSVDVAIRFLKLVIY